MAVAASATSNVASGNYATPQTVTLSTAEVGGVIYYTLDGTAPTAASTAYTAPIVLAAGTKTYIKALVVAAGKDNSAVLTLYITIEESFLAKIRRAVRRSASTDVDAELTDIIAECRIDLQSIGVIAEKAASETDSLILGVVRCFARWKFGLSNDDAEANKNDYMQLRDELRRKRDYISYAITFAVTTGTGESETEVDDATIEFNGETKKTGALGTAVFYYVVAGMNQEYTVSKTGYVTTTTEIDVTASTTVSVSLTAG